MSRDELKPPNAARPLSRREFLATSAGSAFSFAALRQSAAAQQPQQKPSPPPQHQPAVPLPRKSPF
ncbi:MAG: hypothetical protein WBL33_15995, partial [Candidatus Acidiferrales bacterium]